jgi:apolipoprotein D and lipocalin family protein
MGRWYEIARIPNWFEKECTSNVTAEYTLMADGIVRVVNSCTTREGKIQRIEGQAEVVDCTTLQVTFPGVPNMGPKGNYQVVAWDPYDYQWALVATPDKTNLWILSRQPTLNKHIVSNLITIARGRGYDVQKLVFTQQ